MTRQDLGCQARSKGVIKAPSQFIHWDAQRYCRGLWCGMLFSSRYNKSISQETQSKTICISPPKLHKAGYLSHFHLPQHIQSDLLLVIYKSEMTASWYVQHPQEVRHACKARDQVCQYKSHTNRCNMLGDGICHPLCFTLFWHIIKVKLSFDESPDDVDPQVTEDSNKPVCVCSSCHNWIQKPDYPFLYAHFLPQNEKSHRKFQQQSCGLVLKETLIVLQFIWCVFGSHLLSLRQIGELCHFQLIFPGVSPL